MSDIVVDSESKIAVLKSPLSIEDEMVILVKSLQRQNLPLIQIAEEIKRKCNNRYGLSWNVIIGKHHARLAK